MHHLLKPKQSGPSSFCGPVPDSGPPPTIRGSSSSPWSWSG